jgi:sulfatase modifying factor 1
MGTYGNFGYDPEVNLIRNRWSFVLDSQASEDTREEVDSERGYGRVKDAQHWMAVVGADWAHPYGPDSDTTALQNHPVVQVSLKDAAEYCHWAGAGDRRLPNEKEWEFAARGGLVNNTYPWGDKLLSNHMNIWDGEFPKENTVMDGYHGTNPVKVYPPNGYGLYNMVGNVWEWVTGGTEDKRILRGGSFVDSGKRLSHWACTYY